MTIKKRITKILSGSIGMIAAAVVIVGAAATIILAPFINHIVWCINTAEQTIAAIALLIIGVVIPPVGWVHGVALFLGYTWI